MSLHLNHSRVRPSRLYTSIIMVVADPSVFDPMKARIAAKNVGASPLTITYASTRNVLVITGFTHPTRPNATNSRRPLT